jgi:two-component system phosphate regulon sensor histidine kinase PhoR
VARDFLEKALTNALRLNALLTDLIEISKIESGQLKFSFRYFDIVGLISEIVATMEIRGSKRGINLVVETPNGDALTVYGDKERLTQVLTNLIDNAVKYNRENGTVTISAAKVDNQVQLSIADTGIGIPEADVDRVFERFFRVDKARSRAVGGTGLGLSIVKHILEAHDTQARVTSEQGVGTTFSFKLKSA